MTVLSAFDGEVEMCGVNDDNQIDTNSYKSRILPEIQKNNKRHRSNLTVVQIDTTGKWETHKMYLAICYL